MRPCTVRQRLPVRAPLFPCRPCWAPGPSRKRVYFTLCAFCRRRCIYRGLGTGGGALTGLLSFTETTSSNGYIVRDHQYSGKYTVFPDCSGGTLDGQVFNFYFEKGGTEIVLVSTDQGTLLSGGRSSAPRWPVRQNPLQALAGTWTLATDGFVGSTPYSSVGLFTASVGTNRSGGPTGVLATTDTVNFGGQITNQATGTGTYQLLPDCSVVSCFSRRVRPPEFRFLVCQW